MSRPEPDVEKRLVPETVASHPKGGGRSVADFVALDAAELRRRAVSDLGRFLSHVSGIRSFGPGENPSAPGCYRGDFRSEEGGVLYEVLMLIGSEGTPTGQVPGTPWMVAWKMANRSYVEVSTNDGRHWKSSLSDHSRFLEKGEDSSDGFFLPISDSLTLQIFPKLYSERKFGYLGNAYLRREDRAWTKTAEFELKAAEIRYCVND